MPSKKSSKPKASPSVGTTLKSERLNQGLSLAQVERATKIRGKYLTAIESDNYGDLPHNIYTKGFVQSYADYLGLDAPAIAISYATERGKQELQLKRTTAVIAPRQLTPRLLTGIAGTLAAIAVATYLFIQLSVLTAPPTLNVQNPNNDQVVYGSLITVSGHVEGGGDVFVNDSPILVDGSGNFTDSIALQDGINSIRISAKNRLNKTSTITRNILAHVPKTDVASLLPTAPFDGVATSVQAGSKSVTVTITADGKQSFKGTLLPGTNQTFKAKQAIVIGTSDAGNTSVTITNSVVASKSLGALGAAGQAKSDFEFDKDTQFQ